MKSQIRTPTVETLVWILAAVLALAGGAEARALEVQELLIKKGVQRGDQYLAGKTVDVHGKVEGDITMAAFQAGLDGVATGDVNAVGLLVHVGGVVHDDVRALGGKVIIQGWVGDGLLAAGGEITITRNTRVGGDAMLAGRRIVNHGDVEGDIDAVGSYVEIDGDVGGAVRVRSDEVVIGPRARLSGDLVVHGANPPRIDPRATLGGKVTVEGPVPPTWRERAVGAVREALMQLGFLLLAAVWMAVAPTLSRDAAALEWRSPGFAETLGIAAVFGLPLAAVLLAATVVGIPVAIGLMAAWVLLVLAGYASTAIALGGLLAARLRRGPGFARTRERLLWTLAALLLLRVAAAIPVAGWMVTAAAVLAGAGGVANAARLARLRGRVSRGPPDPASA